MKRLHGIGPLQTVDLARFEQSSQRVQRQVFGRLGTSARPLKHLQGSRSCQASWVRGLSACFVSLMLCLNWGFASAADMGVAETKAVIAKAMGISQRLSEPDRQRAQDMFNAAIELMKAKEYKAAAAQFQRGLAIDPGNRNANHNLARLLEVAGDADGALLHYRLATGLAADKKWDLPDFDCPVQMGMDETEFPGFDPKNPSSFSRSQGAAPICDPMAISDFYCFHANKQKSFSSQGLPNSACSAMDTMLQYIKVKELSYSPIKDMFQDGSGPVMDKAYQDLADYFTKNGLCLEKDFTSEFPVGTPEGIINNYLSFSNAVDKAASEGHTLSPLCEECLTIAPNIRRDAGKKEPAIKNLSGNSYLALRQLNEIACSKRNRIPFKKIKIKVARDSGEIRDQIRIRNPVIAEIAADILMSKNLYKLVKSVDPEINKKTHRVIVVGSHVAYGRCYYVVKNSWGQRCEEDPLVPGKAPRLICNKKTGAVSVLAANLEGSRDFGAFWADLDSP